MVQRTPWTPLHARLHQVLRSRHLLPHNQRLLVAVSGGQDSLCLMQLLIDLQPKWEWELAIAHCDHRWREDSADNAAHVAHLAQVWGVPYFQADATQVPVSEAAAREWRYSALQAIAQAHHYSIIVTGHTLSDRAETLLYNLMRGSGSDGLQALAWSRPLSSGLNLVRPLLDFSRRETGEFCQTRQLPVWEDCTNQDWHYARNRIRQELIPYLQANFNTQVERNLAQTAEVMQAEVAYLEAAAADLRHQISHSSQLGLSRIELQKAPLALQRRVIRQFLTQALPTSPNFEQIEKCLQLIAAPNRSRTDPFPGGAIATVSGDWILLE